MNAPKVTAGLTCPPEMLAPTETATKSANACDSDAATNPAGVAAPLFVSLSVKKHNQEEITLLVTAWFKLSMQTKNTKLHTNMFGKTVQLSAYSINIYYAIKELSNEKAYYMPCQSLPLQRQK